MHITILLQRQALLLVTVVSELSTELTCFEPRSVSVMESKGIQERICICYESFSAEIPRDLSL